MNKKSLTSSILSTFTKDKGNAISSGGVHEHTYILSHNGATEIGMLFKSYTDKPLTPIDPELYGLNRNFYKFYDLLRNGVMETRNIKSSRGFELESSLSHSIWTIDSNGMQGWKKTKDIQIGDRVAIARGMEAWGDQDPTENWADHIAEYRNSFKGKRGPNTKPLAHGVMTDDLAYFLGLWIAEGSLEQNIGRCTITCGDSDVGELLESGVVMGMPFKLSSGRSDQWRFNSYELLQLFQYLKMPLVKAPEKRLPAFAWSGSREMAVHLLSGMWDGDGYICTKRNKAGYTTASKQLARDVQLLLTNFDIISRIIAVESKPTARVKVPSMQYRVEVFGSNISRLKDVLKLRIQRKAETLKAIPDKIISKRDGLPAIKLLEALKAKCQGRKLGKLEGAIGIACRAGSDTTYPTIRHILQNECGHLAHTDAYRHLSQLALDHYYWDKIVEIEQSESLTYYFTAQNTHSFWSNGFISSNMLQAL